ncbi:MAG TPA: hypothetical protein PLC76_05690 [Saprospiraceae bacterium]|nr:hypothetical protein [Saprospiraceae bacterium]QLH30207.1 MAG: hypothetical protein HWD63_13025 [Candidatus Parvibacillus calidus]HRN34339.1 hypothetical protein [Saprospiraceae bacterium]HRP84199.1 hypothetical protein [Saprospiraceae bacterium]
MPKSGEYSFLCTVGRQWLVLYSANDLSAILKDYSMTTDFTDEYHPSIWR